MTKYREKLFNGKLPSPREWNQQLLEAHRKSPGMSSASFSDCRNASNKNSYEFLSETLGAFKNKPLSVIDLACGDGVLIPYLQSLLDAHSRFLGLDMSDDELRQAGRKKWNGSVQFLKAQAQSMPLPTESADAIVCHMAFMLMLPLEPVIKEITRVLKPGGLFAAIINNRSQVTGPLTRVMEITQSFLHRHYPNMATPVTGDPRVQSLKDLQALFSKPMDWVSHEDEAFGCTTDGPGVWNKIKDLYLIGMLDSQEQDLLKKEILQAFEGKTVEFKFSFRRFVVQKLSEKA